MQPNVRKAFVYALLASFVLAMCAPPAAPTPERIVETQVVTVVETQIVNQTQVVEQPVEVVVTATPAPVSATWISCAAACWSKRTS